MNHVSIYRASVDASGCTGCGKCAQVCPMAAEPVRKVNGAESIRCGACERACKAEVIHFEFTLPEMLEQR